MKKIAIVPAYNEQGAIGGVVDELRDFDPELDVVVVDDCSRDETAARQIHALNEFRRPRGKQNGPSTQAPGPPTKRLFAPDWGLGA